MNERNLKICKGDDMHSDASPEGHAMTADVDCFPVIKPSIMVTSNSEQKEEELNFGFDAPSTKRGQYFSTPVQKAHRQWTSAAIDLQDNPFGYKSFFSLECDQIIHHLQSKAVQDWSASKRKLEELDISTIEAEPLPLLCYTPKSLLDETTCSAKRRRLDFQGDKGNFSLCSTKHNSPGLGMQGPEKVHGFNQSNNGDKNSIQEKSSPHFNSESQSKRSLFLKTSRTARPQSNRPANREKSVLEKLRSGACSPLLYYRIHNKMKFQNPESPAPAPEFRSFFAAECEKICNQLKRHDTGRMISGDVSSIEAEPPPVLSATINATIILELDSICKENSAMGVSQLDLEKMNINYSIFEKNIILQKALDTVLCNSNASGPKEEVMVTRSAQDSVKIAMSLANTTQDIYNEESADGAIQRIKIVHGQVHIADITQDIGTMHDEMTEVDATQGMVTMHEKGSTADPTHTLVQMHGNVSPADAPQANVRLCDGMSQPCLMQDIVKVHEKVPIANATQDIIMCADVSIANGTQVIVAVDDWAARNAIQDNLTKYSKTPSLKEPIETGSSDFSVANVTRDITAICSTAPDVEAMQNMRTVCNKNSTADTTQEVMNMFNGVCRTDVTHEIMTVNLPEADVIVDIGTMWATGTDPEDKDSDILHVQSESATQRNIVVHAPLQNVTLIKNANVVNYFQNTVSSHSEMTQDSGMYKTFTQCKVTEPNVTHDIVTMNRGMATNTIQDRTQLLSYKDAPNILPDISIIDDEKPKMNATQTLISICNKVTAIDGLQDRGDLTKVIATNCTLLDLPKNVYTQPEKQSRPIWPMAALAHSSPRSGSMCNMKDSTYNLELTDIAHDESVFYNGPISFITSTPLPSLGNRVLIKKSCGLPVKSNPSFSSGQQDNRNKVTSAQRAAMPHASVTRQPVGGEPRSREVSRGVLYPNIPKRVTSKVVESRMSQPAPRSTLAVLKTPLMAKGLVSKKDQVALGRTSMKPPLAPTSLPRKYMQSGQPGNSGASSSILQRPTPVNCTRTDIDFFKKGTDVPKFPASSLVRPPFGLFTPGCQIYAGKVQNIPGPQSAARVCKLSSVHPSSVTAGFHPSGSVRQEYNFIRPTNPVGSQISSELRPRASGLPVWKSQEAFLKPSTN